MIYSQTAKRKAYRKWYYKHEPQSVKDARKAWEKSAKGKRCKFNTHLKSWYGITIEQYEEKLKAQNFSCAICERHQSMFKNRLHVDHDHATRNVRGLLCMDCNTRLETLENINFRFKASAYLQKFKIKD